MVRSRIVRSTASSSGPSSSSSGPLRTSSCRLRVPTTGARATPTWTPTSASASVPVSGQALPQPGCGQHGLQAAAAAARALGAVGVDHDVADLAGRRAVAVQQGALEHQPGAHTGADPDQHQPAVAGVAERVLAEHGGVGVVRHEDRHVERRPQSVGQRGAVPAEVGRVHDHAGGVHDTGGADADAEHRPGGGVDQLADQLVDEGDGVLAAAAVERPAAPLLDVAGEVEQRPGHDRVAARRRGRPPRSGGPPRPAAPAPGACPPGPGPGSGLGEQPVGDQVTDDVGDGHAGQPAGAGQVGPAGRAVAEQQLQQQRPVVAAGVLREVPARGAQRPASRGGGRRHVC